MKKKKKKKKVRVKYKNIIIFLLLIGTVGLIIYSFVNIKITNIFIKGNSIYKDQEIIRMAKIEGNKKTFKNSVKTIEKRLESDLFVFDAIVKKKDFTKIYIEIIENYPLYYYNGKTILFNKDTTDGLLNSPILINEVPQNIKLYEGLKKIDRSVLNRISEIKYIPDTVDANLFRFTMTDGNYTVITLSKIEKINSYVDLVREFNNKTGTLYLNSGEYFEIN